MFAAAAGLIPDHPDDEPARTLLQQLDVSDKHWNRLQISAAPKEDRAMGTTLDSVMLGSVIMRNWVEKDPGQLLDIGGVRT